MESLLNPKYIIIITAPKPINPDDKPAPNPLKYTKINLFLLKYLSSIYKLY